MSWAIAIRLGPFFQVLALLSTRDLYSMHILIMLLVFHVSSLSAPRIRRAF